MTVQMLEQAVAAVQTGNWAQAETLCHAVIRADRKQFGAYLLLGVVKAQHGAFEEARANFRQAIKLNPQCADAYINLGRVEFQLGDRTSAARQYEKALSIEPRSAMALSNYSIILRNAGRLQDALAQVDRALAIEPRYPDALVNRGNILTDLKRYDEAIAAYGAAIGIFPGMEQIKGDLLHAMAQICDWRQIKELWAAVLSDLDAGHGTQPMPVLATPASAAELLRCAQLYDAHKSPQFPALRMRKRLDTGHIKVAYLSGDLRDHAVSYLLSGVIEHHDRLKFETFGLSLVDDPRSPMKQRLKAAFQHFHEVGSKSDAEIARLIDDREIDIVVDLAGYTQHMRLGILASRPAPVQINYLGFMSTMGSRHRDYILADRTTIPERERVHYTEQVAYLPGSFMPQDNTRAIAAQTPSRATFDLPDHGLVFCAFNNGYKITPMIFDVWMSLLRQVEGSVLWLSQLNETARTNLRREAEQRGVASDRLVFANRVEKQEDHLARHRLADVFLDTPYYNAHTTASDALWAGLPIITCEGHTFAGRVASSLLRAAGLSELVTTSHEDYEALALKLARDPGLLASIKAKLAANRSSAPLFDTARYTRHLEAAYLTMVERARRGQPPQTFAVQDLL
ncbi:MAG: tetratricopeptide repeat protein [Xanthobacteraceae bacterium]|nr:tetratricopeptide repeat protein [Xanthobacteraceae bacterium]